MLEVGGGMGANSTVLLKMSLVMGSLEQQLAARQKECAASSAEVSCITGQQG